MKNSERAEKIGRFRDILWVIAEKGPSAPVAEEYRILRGELVADKEVVELLPEFVIECRNIRDFWNYIQRAFSKYAERSQYIEAQLLPIERQFRPERQRTPGIRPLEVRIEYSPIRPAALGVHKFVSETRIAQLRTLSPATFDLRKLIRLCEEINVAYTGGALLATAMLTRAILDHVPPIFAVSSFSQVANNYAGARSFKETMDRLDKAARKIADGYLHGQIRAKETLPEPQQVNFEAEIDALLAEIVRTLS
ncbi:MAG: hypothetical protein ABSG44_21455 [Thermodesulfobacteriota bacterium]|jgi:hypothetical protein